jgi:hypothetical protein
MDKPAPLGNQAALRILFCVASAWTPCALADQIKPKFGLNAVPIQQATDYLRRHPAPDYWALGPFYWPQSTGSDCSVVSIAMLLNAIRGVLRHAEVVIITPEGNAGRRNLSEPDIHPAVMTEVGSSDTHGRDRGPPSRSSEEFSLSGIFEDG